MTHPLVLLPQDSPTPLPTSSYLSVVIVKRLESPPLPGTKKERRVAVLLYVGERNILVLYPIFIDHIFVIIIIISYTEHEISLN